VNNLVALITVSDNCSLLLLCVENITLFSTVVNSKLVEIDAAFSQYALSILAVTIGVMAIL